MKITNIKKHFNNLLKETNKSFVTLDSLSKEMGISNSKLMEFIEKNNKLFRIGVFKDYIKNYGMCVLMYMHQLKITRRQ